jgi:hypothetical protein
MPKAKTFILFSNNDLSVLAQRMPFNLSSKVQETILNLLRSVLKEIKETHGFLTDIVLNSFAIALHDA